MCIKESSFLDTELRRISACLISGRREAWLSAHPSSWPVSAWWGWRSLHLGRWGHEWRAEEGHTSDLQGGTPDTWRACQRTGRRVRWRLCWPWPGWGSSVCCWCCCVHSGCAGQANCSPFLPSAHPASCPEHSPAVWETAPDLDLQLTLRMLGRQQSIRHVGWFKKPLDCWIKENTVKEEKLTFPDGSGWCGGWRSADGVNRQMALAILYGTALVIHPVALKSTQQVKEALVS